MVLFPNCKINLGLNIIRKREDGYHDLETVFYPVGLKDALEAIRLPVTGSPSSVSFNSTGLSITGDAKNNLCIKAYHLLQKDFPEICSLQMHLHKAIPMGAGLGGGSADGAFALLLINQMCELNLTEEQLAQYALQLGSDCPFFILNKPCFATGRGEKMQPILLDLSAYHFVLVNPGIHVSTALAFSQIIPGKPTQSLADIIQLPVTEWKKGLVNDFEEPISQHYPAIATIKQELYRKGAVYASMTGSGSTVYGLFPKEINPHLSLDPNWRIFEIG
ncbi:MAG: 4-(cytidine 5'-diphospho)-2-C-methyl-D-erythritol kinase [Bacteroidota bacterium]